MFSYVIGLEIHVQLKTESKMFCRCSNDGENQPPNTTICPLCMGHPGTLPVANETAIMWSAKTALALTCTIQEYSKFDRKNYFYPDLPKGYQISQYDQPIGKEGFFDITISDSSLRTSARIRINRLHLEEDAAKLTHAPNGAASYVDFNRAGTPLAEIVTEPDLRTPQEAKIFLQELRLLVRMLDVSSGDMEKGHLRCDANVSIQFNHEGLDIWTPVSEIKNLNSFRAVEHALEYEGARLYAEWIEGGDVRIRKNKITVGWDDEKKCTTLQRGKEEAHDYRYFPEPDLPPLHFTKETIERLRASLPELPAALRLRFQDQYHLLLKDCILLTEEKERAAYFEQCVSELDEWLGNAIPEEKKFQSYQSLSNFLLNKILPRLVQRNDSIATTRLRPECLARLVQLLEEQTINSTTALLVLDDMLATGNDPDEIIASKNLFQVTDNTLLEQACDAILAAQSDAVRNFKAGKTNVIMFLVGQVMKEMKGKAQPETVRTILERKLA